MIRKIILTTFFFLLIQTYSAMAGTTGSEDLSKKSATSADECFEGFSRAMFKFNHALDGAIFEPVARGYRSLPVPIRKGTGRPSKWLRNDRYRRLSIDYISW